MKEIKKIINLGIVISFIFIFAGTVSAITILPDPLTPIPGAPSGETVAFWHDDFWAYSAKLNTVLGYEGFDIPTGTGGLDVLIYTGANGAKNVDVGIPPIYTFQNPMDAPGGNATTFEGEWGNGGANKRGPVLVDNLLNYFHTTFGPDISIPVFDFDMNQTGAGPDLWVGGEVYIWDPVNNSKVESWFLDNIDNDIFDSANLVKADGVLYIPTPFDPTIPDYVINHNTGSGKLDYIAYAPAMDLDLYYGNGYWFVADFHMTGLNNGPEELFITGQFAPPPIPEPSTMILLGSGFIGLAVFGRKRFFKK